MFNIIKLNAKDNIAVAPMNIPLGTEVNSNLKTENEIPYGHKISLVDIKKDELIYKYGQIIGIASEDIKKGSHVHTHNLIFHEFDRNYKFIKKDLNQNLRLCHLSIYLKMIEKKDYPY